MFWAGTPTLPSFIFAHSLTAPFRAGALIGIPRGRSASRRALHIVKHLLFTLRSSIYIHMHRVTSSSSHWGAPARNWRSKPRVTGWRRWRRRTTALVRSTCHAVLVASVLIIAVLVASCAFEFANGNVTPWAPRCVPRYSAHLGCRSNAML